MAKDRMVLLKEVIEPLQKKIQTLIAHLNTIQASMVQGLNVFVELENKG